MKSSDFHPSVYSWFKETFAEATAVQTSAWPAIRNNQYTLIAAPTGSGKTLAAFMVAIDDLVRQSVKGNLLQETQVVYISPLKALGNDIERNLQIPIQGITHVLKREGVGDPGIKVSVRSGDTTPSERSSMLRKPPHILVTTPESFYLLLTSVNGRKMLSNIRTVIVDEIHAIAGDKRGAHLSLSLERLENIVTAPLRRIGLSATQKPIENIAGYLKGNRSSGICHIVNHVQPRSYDLELLLPHSPLSAVMSNEIWKEIHQQLIDLIREHRTTLIFVNTRRLAERLSHSLAGFIGKDEITAHHGSMSRGHREKAEQLLKGGSLKALVATASLELGIDIGSVDLVVQISSPRRISTFIQRLGRSRHYVKGIPKGRIVPLTLNDLIECTALIDCVYRNELDALKIPDKPLDVLAQQIVAEVACRDYTFSELFGLIKSSYSYQNLNIQEFEEVVETLAKGYATRRGRSSAYIAYDSINMILRAKRSARITAILNGGAIPDSFDFDVVLEPDNTLVGTVNEDFATESLVGDIFQLGNSSWQIKKIENGKVRVTDAQGKPPDMPFWLGEAPGRSNELSYAVSRLIQNVTESMAEDHADFENTRLWLRQHFHLTESAVDQLIIYLSYTKAALGDVPGSEKIILERFFDQAGDTHIVVHSLSGMRMNKAWGLALRNKLQRRFNTEIQAAANDNGIVLSLGPNQSFPLEEVYTFLDNATIRDILVQALLDSPVFGVRWRWNASVALAITRRKGGKRLAPQLQRMQSEDLISQVFPDIQLMRNNGFNSNDIPDHPLLNQTINDCLHEALDIDKLTDLLDRIEHHTIKTLAVDIREPSPMAQEILVAQPYAFLDNAPLEERRVKAVYSRRWNDVNEASSMAELDPQAVVAVMDEAWPRVRNAEELYEALMVSGFLTEQELSQKGVLEEWKSWFEELVSTGRAAILIPALFEMRYWVAVERLPEVQRILPSALAVPEVIVPEKVAIAGARIADPLLEMIRSRLEITGPVNLQEISVWLPLHNDEILRVLGDLEREGFVFKGRFRLNADEEWCERHLLARIHRYTIAKLRRAIQPVSPSAFMSFLFRWQKMLPYQEMEGPLALQAVLRQLEGYESQSVAWEGDILPARIRNYDYTWLDLSMMSGEFVWGRFRREGKDMMPNTSIPIRTTPITFVRRENLKYYQELAHPEYENHLSGNALIIKKILVDYGAQFFYQLQEQSRLLHSQVEDALTALIAFGLVSSDSYTGLRSLLIPDKYFSARRKHNNTRFSLQQAGRWWLIKPEHADDFPEKPEDHLDRLSMMLLNRYGIVFRKLAEKEKLLTYWYDLLKIFRRMEARGEIRGGRFVDGFGGEQFALPDAITSLRNINQPDPDDSLIAISASDPLNLTGFITPGKRIASIYSNRILYQQGKPVAVKEGKEITFLAETSEALQWELKKLLIHRDVQPELRPYLSF